MEHSKILATLLTMAVTACGQSGDQAKTSATPATTTQATASTEPAGLMGRWLLQAEKSRVGQGANAIPKPEICEIDIDDPKVTMKCSEIVVDHLKREVSLGTERIDAFFTDGRGDPGFPATSTTWIEPGKKLETKYSPRAGLQQTNTWVLSSDGNELTLNMHVVDQFDDLMFKKVYKRSERPK